MVHTIYGNPKALQTLTFLKESGRLCHAYLITGEQGLGKKTFARRMAAQILCKNREAAPCGECESCVKIEAGAHPDFIPYDGAGAKNSIHIAEVRAIRSDAFIRPNESEYKVYAVYDCDNMTIGAANALLKVLEEPPRYAVFLLTCKNPGSLPETIRSRCVEIPLAPVGDGDCKRALDALAPDSSEEERARAAAACGGNIGAGLTMLKEGSAQEVLSIAGDIAAAISQPSEYELLSQLARCGTDRMKTAAVFEQLIRLLRGAMLQKAAGSPGEDELQRALCARLTLEDFIGVIQAVQEARDGIDKNAGPALLCTWVSARIKSIV